MKNKLLALIFVSSPLLYKSQGFQVNLQGQKQQAMGAAGTALIQDAAAVFFNPGGISFLNENSVAIGATATIGHTTFLDANTNSTAETKSPIGNPFAAYAVWGKKEGNLNKFKFGLGAYTPFGSTVRWEDGWAGRFTITSLKLVAIFIQPTISYKVNDKIGIGAGFVYSTGEVELKRDLPLMDSDGNYGSVKLASTAKGFGFNSGIYYKPIEKFSVGLTYRSQVKMSAKNGTATFTVPASLAENFPSGKFSTILNLPQVLTLGFAYKLNEKLDIALDINFIGWKCYDTLTIDYENNTSKLSDTKMIRNYKNTFAFRSGAQYKVSDKFTYRLGLGLSLSPAQDGYVSPETPDANRINYTTGFSYKITSRFFVDASYTFAAMLRKDKNMFTNLDGSFKTYFSGPGLSVVYNF